MSALQASDYTLIDSQAVGEVGIATLYRDRVAYGGRTQTETYLVSTIDSVAVVGQRADGYLLLVRQYRHPLRAVLTTLPMGRLHPGEDPLSGARREFEEETGYVAARWHNLGQFVQFPGTLRAFTHLFFAADLHPTAQQLEAGEVLELHPTPVETVLAAIASGDYVDAGVQLGVLLALQRGLLR